MPRIEKIHNEVYDLLVRCREVDPSLYFSFRRSNRDGRLERGYWFYGNEGYLAVSFWTGFDWKNKTPNIFFVIIPDTKETYLEVSTSDSEIKRKFVVQYIVDPLALKITGHRYRKDYTAFNENYLESLEHFIKNDKVKLDEILKTSALSFFESKDSGIYFIEQEDFEEQKQKVEKYRSSYRKQTTETKPVKIKQAEIQNYGPIHKIQISEIPFSSQWIFFTGENGTGKTSILRALSTSLCLRKANADEFFHNGEFSTNITLYSSEEDVLVFNRFGNDVSEQKDSILSGFAAYGQSRLKTSHRGVSEKALETASSSLLFSSLFDEDTYLIDLQTQFEQWRASDLKSYSKRQGYITEILTDILPNLHNIIFDDLIEGQYTTSYVESDNQGVDFKKVTYGKLASGLKSMIAMIGDILARLYNQQPFVSDPSEFTGIILIDEIDVHLHPKLQKQLVQQLTKTFPKIQFIATTHSPIPFLGAPKNSQIFRVERNSINGVQIQRLDNLLELGDLLPNTILTSPIFGFNEIIPESHDSSKMVRTEDSFKDIEFNDQVKRRIDEFLSDEKEQQLISLFKSRRK